MAKRQLIIFELGGREFGIGIKEVEEIIEYQEPKPLPTTSEAIKGMINLRGDVVVIVDLKKKLNLDKAGVEDRILVVNTGETKVGFVVDSASEVLNLSGEELKPPPDDKLHGIKSGVMKAIGEKDDRLIIILDLERLIESGHIKELAVSN